MPSPYAQLIEDLNNGTLAMGVPGRGAISSKPPTLVEKVLATAEAVDPSLFPAGAGKVIPGVAIGATKWKKLIEYVGDENKYRTFINDVKKLFETADKDVINPFSRAREAKKTLTAIRASRFKDPKELADAERKYKYSQDIVKDVLRTNKATEKIYGGNDYAYRRELMSSAKPLMREGDILDYMVGGNRRLATNESHKLRSKLADILHIGNMPSPLYGSSNRLSRLTHKGATKLYREADLANYLSEAEKAARAEEALKLKRYLEKRNADVNMSEMYDDTADESLPYTLMKKIQARKYTPMDDIINKYSTNYQSKYTTDLGKFPNSLKEINENLKFDLENARTHMNSIRNAEHARQLRDYAVKTGQLDKLMKNPSYAQWLQNNLVGTLEAMQPKPAPETTMGGEWQKLLFDFLKNKRGN